RSRTRTTALRWDRCAGEPRRCYERWKAGNKPAMSASPIRNSACRKCGEELAPGARFCSSCGAPVDELPPLETVAGPVARESVEQRWLGVPARFVLLCLGFAAFGAAIGLFATGSWAWGIVLLLLAIVLLAALAEATRRNAGVWAQHSSRLAADGRAHASTTAEARRAERPPLLTLLGI